MRYIKLRARALAAVAAVALAAVALAACGSNDGSSSGTSAASATQSSPTTAADPGVTAAQKIVEQDMKVPTQLPGLKPLSKKPPAGTSLVWVQCDVNPACSDMTKAVTGASKAAGVKMTVIPFQTASVETLLAAMKRAASLKPSAVLLAAMPKVAYKSQLAELQTMHVPVLSSFVQDADIGDGVVAVIGGSGYTTRSFTSVANWMIADSNGDAHALIVNLPDFPIYQEGVPKFQATIKAGCPKCTTKLLNIPTADLAGGSVPGKVVAALQADPKLNYVVFANNSLSVGTPDALKAAGLSARVKLAGQVADPTIIQQLDNGKLAAWATGSFPMFGWSMVDTALRAIEGDKFSPTGPEATVQLLTKANATDPNTTYATIPGFEDQFKTLWHVGG